MLTVENLKTIADELLEGGEPEAYTRSAINRYYYFCHLTVRQIAEDQTIEEFEGDSSDHETAVDVLTDFGLDGLADNLQELYHTRGHADYEIGYEPSGRDVRLAQGLAERLPERLEEQGVL